MFVVDHHEAWPPAEPSALFRPHGRLVHVPPRRADRAMVPVRPFGVGRLAWAQLRGDQSAPSPVKAAAVVPPASP